MTKPATQPIQHSIIPIYIHDVIGGDMKCTSNLKASHMRKKLLIYANKCFTLDISTSSTMTKPATQLIQHSIIPIYIHDVIGSNIMKCTSNL